MIWRVAYFGQYRLFRPDNIQHFLQLGAIIFPPVCQGDHPRFQLQPLQASFIAILFRQLHEPKRLNLSQIKESVIPPFRGLLLALPIVLEFRGHLNHRALLGIVFTE